MKYKHYVIVAVFLCNLAPSRAQNAPGLWSLQDCISHAVEHNIQLQKSRLTETQAALDLSQKKAELFPSLSFSTSQNLSYRPLQESASNIVANGMANSSSNKLTENGSYGLNASWTVWDGGANRKNIQSQKLQHRIYSLDTQQTANSIQEQIAQLYVQILYSTEACKVNESLQKTAQDQHKRGKEMYAQGLISKADLAQLEAQESSSQYDVVSTRSQIANYKRQLKELLEIGHTQSFEIAPVDLKDEYALQPIPDETEVYETALRLRPEIQSSQLNVESANLNIDIAKAGYYPSISLTAGVGSSHYSGSSSKAGEQLKQNLNASAGITLSIPIFDNKKNKTNLQKAKLNKLDSELDLQNQQIQLSSTIEEFWINAHTNQQNFIAASAKVKSMEASYELLNEQFNNGLKNIVELLTGRDQLLSAQQEKLQSKYNTILHTQLLKFYKGESMSL